MDFEDIMLIVAFFSTECHVNKEYAKDKYKQKYVSNGCREFMDCFNGVCGNDD